MALTSGSFLFFHPPYFFLILTFPAAAQCPLARQVFVTIQHRKDEARSLMLYHVLPA